MQHQLTVEIERPPAVVFAALNDQEHLRDWVGGLLETHLLEGPANGPGTRFRQVLEELGHRLDVQGEVLEYDPDRKLTVKLVAPQFETTAAYQLEAISSTSTRLDVESTTKLIGWGMRLLTPMIQAGVQKKLKGDFERLKTWLEKAD